MSSAANKYIDDFPWIPQIGPQEQAYFSEADMVLYGGAAGGGKTSLAVGLCCTRARESLFVRREATQLGGVIDYMAEVVGSTDGLNKTEKVWELPPWDGIKRKVVFGSCPNPGDSTKYMGRPKDHLIVDEAANMLEAEVAFLRGWVRSTIPGQRCRTLLCSNPPTTAEGAWLTKWFAPWLDPHHPNPAEPGDLRWYASVDGKEVEWPDGEVFEHGGEKVIPQSRTFISAKVQDNAYLRDTGYLAQLQALPEPLRSQMLYGDWNAGREDSEWQCIPSEWVRLAQQRWTEKEYVPERITSVGVDPSRGGRDKTIVAAREGWHFHKLNAWDGEEMSSGGKVAAEVVKLVGTSACPVHVDVIGIGSSVLDHLDMLIGTRAVGVNSSEKSSDRDWSGNLNMANKRAELWWAFRDILNPDNGHRVELPPDAGLFADLCAPTYSLKPAGIQIESKEHIVKRLGRSPDRGDAVVYCAERTPVLRITDQKGHNIIPRFTIRGQLSG